MRRFPWELCIVVAFAFAWLWSRRADGSRKHCEWYWVGIIGVLLAGCVARIMLPERASEKLVLLSLLGFVAIRYLDQWVVENRQRQSAQWKLAGRCAACGYDIRAAETICPECGTPVPVTQPTDNPPMGPQE